MPELCFSVLGASTVAHSAAPAIAFTVELSCADEIRAVSLNTQVRIEAATRPYSATEQRELRELFGDRSRFNHNLSGVLWANVATPLGPFTGHALAEVIVPVTFDFSVAAAKYFQAVGGEVPVRLLFSGTVFHLEAGALQTAPLPWSSEARFTLPAGLWQRTLELHFPGKAALQLQRGVVQRLREFQLRRGFVTLENALEELLEVAE